MYNNKNKNMHFNMIFNLTRKDAYNARIKTKITLISVKTNYSYLTIKKKTNYMYLFESVSVIYTKALFFPMKTPEKYR